MSIEFNLFIAKKAAEYASSIIIKGSSNRPNSTVSTRDVLMLHKELQKLNRLGINYNKFAILEEKIKLIKKYKYGNCYIHSLVVQYYIIKEFGLPATIINLDNMDHCFVLLGSNNPEDFTKWGENAVVCDAWDGKFYPAKFTPIFVKSILCLIDDCWLFNRVWFNQDLLIKNYKTVSSNDANPIMSNNKDYDPKEFSELVKFSQEYDFVKKDAGYLVHKLNSLLIPIAFSYISCSAIKNGNFNLETLYLVFILIGLYFNTMETLYEHEVSTKNLLAKFSV